MGQIYQPTKVEKVVTFWTTLDLNCDHIAKGQQKTRKIGKLSFVNDSQSI